MELSNEQKLLALSSALYLVGIEVEAGRERLEGLCGQGIKLTDPRMMKANEEFNRLTLKYARLEEQYLKLRDKI